MSIFIKQFNGVLQCRSVDDVGRNGNDLKRDICEVEGIPVDDIVLTCNGRLVEEDDALCVDCVYHATLTLRGGKGGFGSILRMLGAQIEKTTNHEACRDLSGRRMRDVNNGKKLAEWVKNTADAEAERERRRREKLERMARDPKHYFVDPNYDQQKQDVADSLEEAVSKGMEASASTSNGASTSGSGAVVKRKAGTNGNSSDVKKRCLWMGVEDDSDDEDDDIEEETSQAHPSEAQPSEHRPTEDNSRESSPASEPSSSTTDNKEGKEEEPTSTSVQEKESAASSTGVIIFKRDMANSQWVVTFGTRCTSETKEDENASGGGASQSQVQEETVPQTTGPVDLSEYTSAADLEALALDRLKTELMDRGLKCGGTLQQRAERLFSIKGLSPDQIDPSLKAKPAKGKKKGKK